MPGDLAFPHELLDKVYAYCRIDKKYRFTLYLTCINFPLNEYVGILSPKRRPLPIFFNFGFVIDVIICYRLESQGSQLSKRNYILGEFKI